MYPSLQGIEGCHARALLNKNGKCHETQRSARQSQFKDLHPIDFQKQKDSRLEEKENESACSWPEAAARPASGLMRIPRP